MEGGKSTFKILTGTPTGKRLLRRYRHKWEDNIRMDLKEIGIDTRNWDDLAKNRDYWRAFVNAALNPIHRINTYFFKIHSNIALLYTPRSS